MARVDRSRLDYIMGIDYLRSELLGMHLVRERIASTDVRITANGDQVSHGGRIRESKYSKNHDYGPLF